MPPQSPQNSDGSDQQQPVQQPAAPNVPTAAPSSWNTLFIVSLVLDVLLPLIGLILGEVLYHKAKVAGDDAWRKKAKWSIYFGCLVIVIILAVTFSKAFIGAKNDTSSSSDGTSTSQSTSKQNGLPSKSEATLYTATIDAAIGDYYGNENTNNQPNYKLSYPTLAQLNDPSWRQTNKVDLSQGDIPSGDLSTIAFVSGQPTKLNQYGYVPSPAGCENTQASPCTGYTLSTLSSSGLYTENN